MHEVTEQAGWPAASLRKTATGCNGRSMPRRAVFRRAKRACAAIPGLSRSRQRRGSHYCVIAVVTAPMPVNRVSTVSPGRIGNCRVNDPVRTISPAFNCGQMRPASSPARRQTAADCPEPSRRFRAFLVFVFRFYSREACAQVKNLSSLLAILTMLLAVRCLVLGMTGALPPYATIGYAVARPRLFAIAVARLFMI